MELQFAAGISLGWIDYKKIDGLKEMFEFGDRNVSSLF